MQLLFMRIRDLRSHAYLTTVMRVCCPITATARLLQEANLGAKVVGAEHDSATLLLEVFHYRSAKGSIRLWGKGVVALREIRAFVEVARRDKPDVLDLTFDGGRRGSALAVLGVGPRWGVIGRRGGHQQSLRVGVFAGLGLREKV